MAITAWQIYSILQQSQQAAASHYDWSGIGSNDAASTAVAVAPGVEQCLATIWVIDLTVPGIRECLTVCLRTNTGPFTT
jgi:hypothetical protein